MADAVVDSVIVHNFKMSIPSAPEVVEITLEVEYEETKKGKIPTGQYWIVSALDKTHPHLASPEFEEIMKSPENQMKMFMQLNHDPKRY